VVISLGRTNANFLALVTALFILCSLPTQAKDYTQAVGTIYCDGAIRGIATHIDTLKDSQDQSVIMTAAHVLYNPQTDQLFNQCHYRPQNKRLSGIAFETISAHNYSVKNKDKIAQAESDLVFIRLKNRAHQPKLKLAQDFYNVESKFSLISSDLDGFKLTRCNKIDHPHLNSDKLLLHNCPVQQGSSGSPLLNASGDVIAIHGGRFTVQIAKDSKESAEWIGQARRVDSKIVFSLDL
jgi:hypothetical protein